MSRNYAVLLGTLSSLTFAQIAMAQNNSTSQAPVPAADSSQLQEIIVTANKRAEAINKVPMSITAVSGDTLQQRGISTVGDLSKLVPSFQASDTFQGTPYYTLRGIGFADPGLGSSPAVTIYSDQIPLPYPSMTRLAIFDVERVEVLKGPQGTLFGNNATGGAINYIPAAPTEQLHAGFNGSFGRFDTAQGEAYVSGPITKTLTFRLAGKTTQSQDWQYNYVDGETTGGRNQVAGRLILEWRPTSRLKVGLTVSGWKDRSRADAAQLAAIDQLNLNGCNVVTKQGCINPVVLLGEPAPQNARAAIWDQGFNPKHNDGFYQASGRIDYQLNDMVSLTSITSYAQYNQDMHLDLDASEAALQQGGSIGQIKSFYEEDRASADFGNGIRLIIGGNYQHDRTADNYIIDVSGSTIHNEISPLLPIGGFHAQGYYNIKNIAGFGNVDWKLNNQITLHAGARYTETHTKFGGCSADDGQDDLASAYNFAIIPALTGHLGHIPPGGCASLGPPPGFEPELTPGDLRQHNVSWRAGIDYAPANDVLFYANVSKGYKAGGFSTIPASSYIQFRPVTQESVIAYEIGTKATLLDRRLQMSAAIFYDDYANKQFRGRVLDPLGIFGALEALVNIPKSRIYGAEAQLTFRPVAIVTFNIGAAYLDSKVTSDYSNYDPFANLINLKGSAFPNTPKWNVTADAEVRPPVNDHLDAFGGLSVKYQSRTSGTFVNKAVLAKVVGDQLNAPGQTLNPNIFDIIPYALFDLRFGLEKHDSQWRIGGFVRNLTDKYYWTSVGHSTDTSFKFPGMPRTYGIEVSYKY